LSYRWEVLRGDPERILIEEKDANGSRVEITIPWHERRPVLSGSAMESNRVDIGLFVGNGEYWSAPAFFSVYFPDNQKRVYDDRGQVLSIDYSLDHYVDPFVDTPRKWQDKYKYDDEGTCIGWTRFHKGEKLAQEFTADGLLIIDTGKNESKVKTKPVRYVGRQLKGARTVLIQEIQ